MQLLTEWLKPQNFWQILMLLAVLWMVVRGKVVSIGGDKGIMFHTRNDTKLLMDELSKIQTLVEASITDRQQIHKKMDDAFAKLDIAFATLHELKLNGMRTQILLSATPFERKLALYDEYKKAGGNSWLDRWIDNLKTTNAGRRETD